MYEKCPIKEDICVLCATYKDELYCGHAKKIKDLKKCPVKKKKR